MTIREKCINKIDDIFNDLKISQELEKSIYNSCISYSNENNIQKKWDNTVFKSLYNDKIRHLLVNIDNNSYIKNNYLKDNIDNGTIKVGNVCNLEPFETFPDIWKKIRDKIELQEKIAEETKHMATTDMFRCGKCKKNKTVYYKLQTRSADEPETTFITCVNCNNTWKQ